MKRIVSLLLSLVIALSLAVPALAASGEAASAANALYELGLFGGTGTDASGNPIFELDRAPTRHEAVTMLVRLLGKTGEAESGTWNMPFTDVAEWAKPYVGYAYANGLASGTSATTFSGNETVSAAQYLTFVLRALGYESGTDFQWNKAWELSDQIGLTDGRYNAGTTEFTRGDVAIISNRSLSARHKPQTGTETTPVEATPSTSTPSTTKGFFAHETVFCKPGKTAMAWLQDATAAEWETCCGDVLITQSDESSCDIYVLSTASTRKHHYVTCTDTNGYKYFCMIDLT